MRCYATGQGMRAVHMQQGRGQGMRAVYTCSKTGDEGMQQSSESQ